ncbi:hypothetical protein [Tateyamaria omphalii]|uniref:Uncharacterized protein n=1 Tax=Tateyamaria omphalii TaxID=299262 RepID=A0A1P8MT36_9RHOB|nr:hypothetical protein [Tateyamaria omphalii]APX11143.1 hypothetical protein BWR18_05140 [Tateyamaria omphalii]
MTATFDAATDTKGAKGPQPPFDMRAIAGFATHAAGAILVLGAIGVWLEPTTYAGADLVVMKLAVSLFLSLAGFLILLDRRANDVPEVEIDTVRREVRVVTGGGRRRKITRRTAIRDLGRAEVMGETVRLKAANGDVLVDVSLHDAQVRNHLFGALQDAGKL